jgi:hypothetical protein
MLSSATPPFCSSGLFLYLLTFMRHGAAFPSNTLGTDWTFYVSSPAQKSRVRDFLTPFHYCCCISFSFLFNDIYY